MNQSLEEAIGFSTVQASRNVTRMLFYYLKPFGITPEQWTVLKRIGESDGVNQKTLAASADKDQPTLTRILDLLAKKKLIHRQKSAQDRRSFLIFPTSHGQTLMNQIIPHLEKVFSEITSGISSQDLETYQSVLEEIQHKTEQMHQQQKG